MSLKFTSGGPAFPAEMTVLLKELNTDVPETDVRTTTIKHGGMTLRDYFAAKAMNVIMPSVVEILQKKSFSEEKTNQLKASAAAACYGMADAMLEARK